jgi:hypothetical protein
MAIAPRGFLVKGPRCTEPSKFGLLSVVPPFTPTDPHWAASGIEWEDDLCGDGTETFIDSCPSDDYEKPEERNIQFCGADPFVAIGSFHCSPVGRPADEAFEIARRRLLAWEGRQVERTLWTGLSSNGDVAPSFAFGNPECDILPIDLNEAGEVDPVTAMSLLETALAEEVTCGGLIHIPFSLMAYMTKHDQIVEIDGGLYSPSGNRIVVGQGYTGSGPDNAAALPGQSWMFATGPMLVARGNVIMVPGSVAEGVNRNINNVTVRAERFYSVGFSCTLLAVRVALTCACDVA